MDPISVNEAIDRLNELNGQTVIVTGLLCLDFEGHCINYIPKSESRDQGSGAYQSSIWVYFDLEEIKHRAQWLDQFDGRHVRATGRLDGPDPRYQACGHMSLWPTKLLVKSIEKTKST